MQPSDDWKEAIKKWYKSNGLSEPKDHDTPSVQDNLGPNYTPSDGETAKILDKTTQLSSLMKLGPLQSASLRVPLNTLYKKPRLTAADICFLRDMKVGL